MATLTRIFEFDAAHRVMHEKMKCFNLHGHRFKVELTFEYSEVSKLGYAIDFKEIKRIAGGWLDDYFDHASILNPFDKELINLCERSGWKFYVMGLGNSKEDLNPSAENIASEILCSLRIIFQEDFKGSVRLSNVRLYETPNCWVDIDTPAYAATHSRLTELLTWAKLTGVINYDDRENAKA